MVQLSENYKNLFQTAAESYLYSYSKVFFSENKWLGAILVLVSYFDYWSGFSGTLAVLTVIVAVRTLGFSQINLENGTYGFNSLLVGLGTGLYFQPGIEAAVLAILMALFTLLIAIAIEGVFFKYGLPILSVPFLFGMWILALAFPSISALGVSERGIYTANELYLLGGGSLVKAYFFLDSLNITEAFKTYFLSLGAIFFQFNILAGMLVAIGLLIYSRIVFSLSLLGFFAAYLFYKFIGADTAQLSYTYMGFNFILTAIAIGGIYLIPSRSSYVWTIILLPLTVLITVSLARLFYVFGLSLYALPFNIVVLLFVYVLKLRYKPAEDLTEVYTQQFSPERNVYFFKNNKQRYSSWREIPVFLPFMGEWSVSQAYDGLHTHKGQWRHALDFIVLDDAGNEFTNQGDYPEDYYCYGKPVLAPADGVVQEIVDGVDDNIIGEANTRQNWGNSIVIKHTDGVYSQLSHIKPGSFAVTKGQQVKQGEKLALCGNSGRSPYPHLHFQIQTTPYVRSPTLEYPISNFVSRKKDDYQLHNWEIPSQNTLLHNIQTNALLKKALNFTPGQQLVFNVEQSEHSRISGQYIWNVQTTAYNESYISCERDKAEIYFYESGNVLYFSNFYGNKNSLLYLFYLALFKVQFGFYRNLQLNDTLPLHHTFAGPALWVQDFVAPFFRFMQAKYTLHYENFKDDIVSQEILLKSEVKKYRFNELVGVYQSAIEIDNNAKLKLRFNYENHTIVANQE